jgi:branched-subunit amino acid ABC-type transport system permease component
VEFPPVTIEFWVTQAFNGISYGALLFLLASGLSLIFGVMRIVNLAHGSCFMLGGYVGLSVVWKTASAHPRCGLHRSDPLRPRGTLGALRSL